MSYGSNGAGRHAWSGPIIVVVAVGKPYCSRSGVCLESSGYNSIVRICMMVLRLPPDRALLRRLCLSIIFHSGVCALRPVLKFRRLVTKGIGTWPEHCSIDDDCKVVPFFFELCRWKHMKNYVERTTSHLFDMFLQDKGASG